MDRSENLSFERRVEFGPAWDKRHSDPDKNYGVHGVDLRFYLVGERGAIQFVVYTGWMLPAVQEEFDARPIYPGSPYLNHKPMPADLGCHSKKPMYEGHEPMSSCHLFDEPCYYDGSGCLAEGVFEVLLNEGSEGVWRELEKWYHEWVVE